MTPEDIDTTMRLFDQVNSKNNGPLLFYYDHHADHDVVNMTAINFIPDNVSTITFLTHGAKFGEVESSRTFWTTLAEKLVMDVSTNV